jgi:hypothetical protein
MEQAPFFDPQIAPERFCCISVDKTRSAIPREVESVHGTSLLKIPIVHEGMVLSRVAASCVEKQEVLRATTGILAKDPTFSPQRSISPDLPFKD